jgi:protein-S-isoprenylcysteine O-methyltransferase Ste14
MFLRALIAFLVLPGVVAFTVPLAWLWVTGQLQVKQPLGLAILAAGVVALLWCVRDFYVAGKGTLAPWAPPENLVVVGLYRYTRNPMYVAVMTILLGWSITFGADGLLGYAVLVAAGFYLRVVRVEEPVLARTFGAQWAAYRDKVPRWLW